MDDWGRRVYFANPGTREAVRSVALALAESDQGTKGDKQKPASGNSGEHICFLVKGQGQWYSSPSFPGDMTTRFTVVILQPGGK